MKFNRLTPVRGAGQPRVDFDNDIIRDVVIVQECEAKGHGVWLDQKFVDDVVSEGNLSSGVKSRFGHPKMCSNSLGDYVGTFSNFSRRIVNGVSQAIADLQLDREIADKSPKYEKSLVDYILAFAKEKPDMFGNSIVFAGKREMREFDNKQTGKKEKRTFMVLSKGGFSASDIVDDPAATSGMFSEYNIASIVTEFVESSDLDISEFDDLLENEAFEKFAKMLLNNHKVSHRILNMIVNDRGLVEEFKARINPGIDLEKVAELFDRNTD